MDFTELYAQKKMTADQAAALVKSGDWVDYGWAVNTPVAVDAAIAKRLPELEDVNFRGGILMWASVILRITLHGFPAAIDQSGISPEAGPGRAAAPPGHRRCKGSGPQGAGAHLQGQARALLRRLRLCQRRRFRQRK